MKNFFLTFILVGFFSVPGLLAFSEFDKGAELTLPEGVLRGVVMREKNGKADLFFVDDEVVLNDEDAQKIVAMLEKKEPKASINTKVLEENESYKFSEFDTSDSKEAWWFYRYSDRYYNRYYNRYHGNYNYDYHRPYYDRYRGRSCGYRSWHCGSLRHRYRNQYISYNYVYNYYVPSYGFRYYFYWF